MQDPNEDTEWNDVLRAKGIIPEKPKEKEVTEDQLVSMLEASIKEKTGAKAKEDMTLDELDELEDEEEERVLEEYRRQRMAEIRAKQQAAKFGEVGEISAEDYVREVNQAGDGIAVVLHLYKQVNDNTARDTHIFPISSNQIVIFLHSFSSGHTSLRSYQPADDELGSQVPGSEIPQEHLDHVHTQLPRPKPAHSLLLPRWRHEGTVSRTIVLQRDEPDSGGAGVHAGQDGRCGHRHQEGSPTSGEGRAHGLLGSVRQTTRR